MLPKNNACPRCDGELRELVRVEPFGTEQGLITYECSRCGHLISDVIEPPAKQRGYPH